MKLGEIIGVAVRRATLEALRWQNGLEASYTRGVCHALGRFGVTEAALMTAVAPHLDATALELLRRNQRAVLMEPLVTAAAYAMASVIDRVRYGTLPASVAADALVQQAATLAISLAAAPSRWSEFRALLHHAARVDGARRRRRARGGRDARSAAARRRRSRARLAREVAGAVIPAWLAPLAPSPLVLGAALVLDLAIGDPAYAAHPVRLIGATIAAVERALRRLGLDGYGGGVLLAIVVAALWVALASAAVLAAARGPAWAGARSCTPSSSTACSRSAICCGTCGASSGRSAPAISTARAPRSARWSSGTPIGWTPPPAAAPPSRAWPRT